MIVANRPGEKLLELVAVMDRLRGECPWDAEQTHESLVRYLVEETYEAVEAIEDGDRTHLREELGDLLLQVMFHARIAAEDPNAPYDIDDVAQQIVEKLIRRHPHVFADTQVEGSADVATNWEDIKDGEKNRESAMDDIPRTLPSLALADKVVARALRSKGQLSVPVPEESEYTADILGEVLFALVAAAHTSGLDPEEALRQRVRKEMDTIRASERDSPGP